jgi:hypothetical protein
MKLWDAKTHMTQGQWGAACARVQNRLNNLEATAEEPGNQKAGGKQQRLGADRRSAKAGPEKEPAVTEADVAGGLSGRPFFCS